MKCQILFSGKKKKNRDSLLKMSNPVFLGKKSENNSVCRLLNF